MTLISTAAWVGLVLVTLAVAFVVTGLVRHYAISRQLLDIPNARSSHSVPTPRGGGMGIVAAVLVMALALPLVGIADVRDSLIYGACGGFVALLGFLDDHGHVPAGWRLLGHFAAAIAAVALAGGASDVVIFGHVISLGWGGHALAVLIVVWMLNLFNFMDGIDGLAGSEAVLVAGIGAVLLAACATPGSHVAWMIVIAAGATGFLLWNWPPARIFMGDAGSGFLGFAFGIAPILAAKIVPEGFWIMLILPGVFVVDATLTLVRRVARGMKPHVAHRSHGYQYVSRRWGGHRPVTLTCNALTLFWCAPLAWAVARGTLDGALALLVAYTPLVALAFVAKSGAPEQQEV